MMLVINAGSSSIKFAVCRDDLHMIAAGSVTEIGALGRVRVGTVDQHLHVADHQHALSLALAALAGMGIPADEISAAAHRVVHGGTALVAPCRITPQVIALIEACVPLAPLHNPVNLVAIRALQTLKPGLPQYASFDTAFHATNPEVATTYALPKAERNRGIRRYGFHGISYAGLVDRIASVSGMALPRRLLALHLGNGASLCAILEGRSVATTMGYSPLDGLTMGTRAGCIDGNAVLLLATLHGIDGAGRILNRESGLLGLGGSNDMRALSQAETAEAQFARDHFGYWALRHAGSMIAAMGGIDALAFTGGIGENDAGLRAALLRGLGWTGLVPDFQANAANATRLHETGSAVLAWIVPAEEELRIAQEALAVRAGEQKRPPI